MAQIIVKSPYLPPNSTGKIEGYLRYISTREGVEKIKQKDSVAYSDEDRKDIINELLKRLIFLNIKISRKIRAEKMLMS